MEYKRAEKIKFYFNKVDSGEMEFSAVRKSLNEENLDPEEINIIVKQVDRKLLRSAELKASHQSGKNLFYGGIVIALLGALLTITTYLGIFDIGNRTIISIGPVAFGLLTMMIGRAKMNRI